MWSEAVKLQVKLHQVSFPASSYMFQVNNRNTRARCEICSKLTIKIPERRQSLRKTIFEASQRSVKMKN